jgi:agmatine deiminase
VNRRNLISQLGAVVSSALVSNGNARAAGLSAKAAGYYFPLETAPHKRTFMQWPSSLAVYGNKKELGEVQKSIADIANAIQKFEPVVVLASADQIDLAKKYFEKNVEFWPFPTQDLWCRDSGPSFVVNGKGELAVTELNFNGWGNKQEHANDAKLASLVAKDLGLRVFESSIVGEGGGVETDGDGTLLAHASSWINQNRNSGDENGVSARLLEALGADKIIWAPGVRDADITDYHIDALARFVGPGVVVIQLPDSPNESDPWSVAAFETYNILKKARDAKGRKLEIVVIPDPINIRSRSEDFVSSYVNYYVCNGAVISAQFGDDKADAKAEETLASLYPNRKVISLDIDPIGESGGGIHCSTQQQPEVF